MKVNKNKQNKAPAPIKSTLSPVKTDNLVVDFESMLVPGAILLAGLMISLSIIFSFRGTNISNYSPSTGTDTNTGTDTGTDTNTGTDSGANDGTVTEVSIDDDPYLGDKKAKVAVIEFSDYECPFCKRHFQEVYPEIYDKYIKTNKILYVFRDLPLSFHEPTATLEAMSANCVFDQKGNDAYFKYHDTIFKTTKSNIDPAMNRAKMIDLAKKQGGLNINTFTKCLDDKKFAEEIKKDSQDAAKININGTPGFVIGKLESDGKTIKNGTFLGGAYPIENFVSTIDALLK